MSFSFILEWTPPFFSHAISILQNGSASASKSKKIRNFLVELHRHSNGTDVGNDIRLLRILSLADLIFLLPAPEAPGLFFIGGLVKPSNHSPTFQVTGTGLSLRSALWRVAGEIAERYMKADLVGYSENLNDESTPIIEMVPYGGGPSKFLPLGIYNNKSEFVLDSKFSAGSGADQNLNDARISALLELIERDAVALWWYGGKRGKIINIDSSNELKKYYNRLRKNNHTRQEIIIDISTNLQVPCVAICSFDRNGKRFASGFAARLDYVNAIKAAWRELGQMEVGLRIVAAKQEQLGESALNENDKKQTIRSNSIDIPAIRALSIDASDHPISLNVNTNTNSTEKIIQLYQLLNTFDINVYSIKRSNSFALLSTIQLIVPELQTIDVNLRTHRLSSVIEKFGQSTAINRDIPIL